MLKRLLNVLSVVCMTIGILLNGGIVIAEEEDEFGSIQNTDTDQSLFNITLPGEMVFDFENYQYSLKFTTQNEQTTEIEIDSSKITDADISDDKKTLTINSRIITYPSAGIYSATIIISNNSEAQKEIQLRNGETGFIEILEENSDSESVPSEGTGEGQETFSLRSTPGAKLGEFKLEIDGDNFKLSALGGTTLEGFTDANSYVAFSNNGDPTNGPGYRLNQISLSADKKTAIFSVSSVGFVNANYRAYLAKIDYSGEQPVVTGDYYDLGFETNTPINVSDIAESVVYNSNTGTIDVIFNDSGKACFDNISVVHADIQMTRSEGQPFYNNNFSIDLKKSGSTSTGFSIPRTLLEDQMYKFMFGVYTTVIRIRADNKPTYTIYVNNLNIGLPPNGTQFGTLQAIAPNNQIFEINTAGNNIPANQSMRFILTDANDNSYVYSSSISFSNNKYSFDTKTFSPVIKESMDVKNIAIVSFANGQFLTNVNQAFSQAITIAPTQYIKGTCVVEPYSDLSNFSLYMTCTDNDHPTDPVVVNFTNNSAYALDVYDQNTPDNNIDLGSNSEGNIELLTINKNSGTNMVSFDTSNINIGTSGTNPSGQLKKYAFSVSATNNGLRVPFFYGILRNSDGTVLTLDNIIENYPKVKIVPGKYEEKNGYYVDCDDNDKDACDAYLTKFHNNEGPNNDPMYSQMMFTNSNNYGRGVRPMEELSDNEADQNTKLVPYGTNHVKLFISTSILEEIGIMDGIDGSDNPIPGADYSVTINLSGYSAQYIYGVYFDTGLQSSNGIKLEFTETQPSDGWVTLKFSADSANKPEDYLESITNLNFNAGNIGNTSHIVFGEGGNAVVANDKMSMRILKSSIAITSGEMVTAKIYSNKYSYQVATLTLTDGFTKVAPEDLITSVKTDGVHVFTQDTDYLNGLTELNIRVERKGVKTVVVDSPSQIDKSKVNTKHEVVFKLTTAQLTTLEGEQRPDNAFWTYTVSDGYVTYWNHATLSVNPALFGASTTLMNQNPTDSPNNRYDDNLENSDEYVQNLKNGYTVKAVVNNNVASVTLTGAISGSIASNNNQNKLYFDEVDGENKQAIVNETINNLDANGVKAVMEYFSGRDFEETGTAFSIELARDGHPITDLAYPIQISVSGVRDGNYKLLSVHNGEPKEIKVTVIDGKAFAYSALFSDFVLVEDKEAPAPAPSKKDSSSGSSASKKDNVVTCQMAGYPASYAWNESAKACQPGYIDGNGVFHLTSGNMNKRVGVVNTSDKGFGGNIAELICSTLVAIAAAYALRKWN